MRLHMNQQTSRSLSSQAWWLLPSPLRSRAKPSAWMPRQVDHYFAAAKAKGITTAPTSQSIA
jgi:hypothetical protein